MGLDGFPTGGGGGGGGAGDATSIQGVDVDPAAPAALDTLGLHPGTGKWTPIGATALLPAGSIDENMLAASVAGSGLTGGAGTELAVGAGTGIQVNANDVALAPGAALANIGALGITSGYVGDNEITTTKIDTNAVTAAKINGGAVTGPKVASGAFVYAEVEGRNGAGACTFTGANVGDIMIGYGWIAGGAAPADSPGFETTITVDDQIQQTGGANLTGHYYIITLLRQS